MSPVRISLSSEWSLSEAIQDRIFQWPWIALFCLTGGLLGWLAALIWPSPTRSAVDLYVGFNPNAVQLANNPHATFNNVDDYKNWQMSSLNSLVYDAGILTETLTELQRQDAIWNEVTVAQLSEMLHASWRNAGRWRLSAEVSWAKNHSSELATQAVVAWHDVILRQVRQALQASNRLIGLQQEQAALIQQRTDLETRLTALRHAQGQSQAWRDILLRLPTAQVLGEVDRQQILLLAASALQDSEAPAGELLWQELKGAFPPADAPAADYLPWLERLLQTVEQQTAVANLQIQTLKEQESRLSLEILQATQESRGLSAALTISDLDGELRIQHTVLRPTGQLLLIGSLLGAILWVMLWLLRLGGLRKQPATEAG